MVIKVTNKEVHFIKGFSDRELKLAEALRFEQIDRTHIKTDVRFSTIDSVYFFISEAYARLLLDSDLVVSKDRAFDDINLAYKKWKLEWFDKFKPDRLYDHVGKKLMSHQMECLWKATYKKYNFLALDMGTGKTLTAASISKMYNVSRTLIICPSLVKWNWLRDLSDGFGFDPMSFTVLDRQKTVKAIVDERFVIVNYESIPKFRNHIIFDDVRHIILDEIHYCKSTKSKRYKNVKELIDYFPNARVTLLSGTPITNRITDLFAYLKLCKVPALSNSQQGFNRTYAKMAGNRVLGINKDKIKELRGVLSNFMIRKKTSDCLELPDIVHKSYYVNKDVSAAKEYKEKFEEMIEARERYHELKEIYDNHPNKSSDEAKSINKEMFVLRGKSRTNLITLNKLCAMSKVSSAIELIDSLIEQDKKVIIFSGFKDPLFKLKYHYIDRCVHIDGSVSALKREDEIEKFKKDPSKRVYIAQITAGGIGVNITNSSNVIFLDLPFTTDKIEQAYKRSHRLGQKSIVNVAYMILENSIDERIFDMVKGKGRDISDVIDDGNSDMDYEKISDKLLDDVLNDYREKKGLPTFKKGFTKL